MGTFYATQERKSGLWSMLVGGQEKVPFEQWRIDVNVQPRRHFSNPANNLRVEARLQAQASQQVEQVLQFVIAHASKCVEHLPPPSVSVCLPISGVVLSFGRERTPQWCFSSTLSQINLQYSVSMTITSEDPNESDSSSDR